MRRILTFVVAVLLLSCLSAQPQTLTPELLWQLRRVSEPQLSPDGSKLLYNVRTTDLAANKGAGQIVLLDLRSGDKRQLTSAGSNSNARWSPDGRRVAFISSRSGSPQIWTIAVDGGEAQQVSNHQGGVANMAWSPDGAHFSFTADVKLEQDIHERHPDLPKADALVFDDLMVRHWDSWKDGTYSHLFVVKAEGGPAQDLMAGMRVDTPLKPFGGGEQIAWSPDGRALCYTAKVVKDPEASTDSSLWLVELANPGKHAELTPGAPGYDTEPRFSPDGKQIAFLSMARPGFEADKNRLMLLDRATGKVRELTEGFDQSAHDPQWTPDGQRLVFASETLGTTQLYRIEAQGGAPQAITAGRYEFIAAVPGRDGAVFALRQRTERPFEVVRLNMQGAPGEGALLTDENGAQFKNLALPTVAERWTQASDGKKILSWVVYPPGFDPTKKYPMLLYCQGGPQSQVGQWFSFRWNFHLMAAQGYIVLGVNRRGLPGFGTAWNDQISGDWGGQAMRDLLSACDDLRKEPYVDPARVAAVGASFGGYSVYWLMGNGGDRFCAMIAHCGVFNLEAMYHATEELFFVNWDLGGPYWKSADLARNYDRCSPHNFVQNWKTPLLVIHGEKDFRVPYIEGLQAFTAAQVRNVPSRFLYFPGEGHWIMSPQNSVLWYREFFRWLDQWCKPAPSAVKTGAAARDPVVERVDDVQVLQLYADGFEELDLKDKLLCYHLSQAAIAGRDICMDQRYAHNLAVRDLLEEMYVKRESLPPKLRNELERYTKAFWIHNGIHHNYSTEKLLLRLTLDELKLAARLAGAAGARVPNEADVERLHAILTDPHKDRSITDKSPEGGADPLAVSCNNLYVGVATADLQGFTERYALNSRLVKRDGKLVEEVYRAGDGKAVPAGLYAKPIEAIIGHLRAALPHAPAKTRVALEHLIRYYQTGEAADWRAFNIAWVQDNDSVVDNVNGFIEVYTDVRGAKGAWQGLVSFKNKHKTHEIEALAKRAQWFEDRMPWPAEFKKKDVKGISARAISVICETGDVGPITPIGVNLPNEADIRQDYGSKSVNLSNVVEAYNLAGKGGAAAEFCWDAAELERAKRWTGIVDDIHTNLHEVVGHASGQVNSEVQNPAQRLGVYYSTLEEARADLVGLYWIGDAEVIKSGLCPSAEAALAQYEAYARNGLVQLRRVALGKKIEEDHMRNRQMIVHWLLEHAPHACKREVRGGKTYYRVLDAEQFRQACGRLLAEVMRVKATGDFAAGKALVENYGTKIERTLHEEVLGRLEALDLPALSAFVQPELRLVTGKDGAVVDVAVDYPRDLAGQMLRWSGRLPAK